VFPEQIEAVLEGLRAMLAWTYRYKDYGLGQAEFATLMYDAWEEAIEPLLNDLELEANLTHGEFMDVARAVYAETNPEPCPY
jgi:hypothetical protein